MPAILKTSAATPASQARDASQVPESPAATAFGFEFGEKSITASPFRLSQNPR
jgi:hypothetical protein